MDSYVLGIVFGLLLAAVAALVFIFTKNESTGFSEKSYDERQQRARATSFKAGFFTIVVYNGLYCVFSAALDPWCDAATGAFIGIALGVSVFAVVSVMKDAYIPLRSSPRRMLFIFVLIAAVNALCSARYFFDPEESMVTNGILTYRCFNLIVTLMFVVLFTAMLIKRGMDRRAEE